MRVFKTTYKDRKGRTREAAAWYVEFRDHLETVRRLPAFVSKSASEELGRNLEKLVAYHKASGGQTDPALTRFLAGLPARTRAKLVAIGLLAAEHLTVGKLLAEHLDDFGKTLAAKGNTPFHVETVTKRARSVVEGCGFRFYSDLSASKVMEFLHRLRQETEEERGISAQTFNFYLQAIKQFCRWMVKDRRASELPLAHLEPLNVQTDRRHDRRELTEEELPRLLHATRASTRVCRRLTGWDRYHLYATACGTGFRASGLASLTPESFDLDADPPTVTLATCKNKSRKLKVQPLPPDVADLLRDYLRDKPAGQPVWPGKWAKDHCGADMMRMDLEAAGIPYVVDGPDGPLFADFHALRHTYLTLGSRAGIDLRTLQELAGHSTPTLTTRYSHRRLHDLAGAVERLPRFLPDDPHDTETHVLRATGTEGASVLASCLALSGGQQGTLGDAGRLSTAPSLESQSLAESAETAAAQGPGSVCTPGGGPGLQNQWRV
jgi:integrase